MAQKRRREAESCYHGFAFWGVADGGYCEDAGGDETIADRQLRESRSMRHEGGFLGETQSPELPN